MFRHEYQDTYRNRVLQVSSNVFLHLHPTKIYAINDTWFRPESNSGTLIGAEWIASEDSPDSYRETADAAAVESARARLVARFPGMTEAPMRGGWAGMVMMSPDGRPIIDQVAGIEGLFVMVGD